ncbi:hypothetical protein D3C80_1774580 [compost metagenome]
MGLDHNPGINLLQPGFSSCSLRHPAAGICFCIQLLPLEVAPLHIVPVGKNQSSDTAAGERLSNAGTQRTCTDNQHT